jgi:hypothetical protein
VSDAIISSRHAIIADKAHRYWELTRLIAEARRSADRLHDELIEWIADTREPIDVEGLPLLRVVERRGGRCWDMKALSEREPREFQRLLELGCLTVQSRLADEQMRAGNLSGIHRQFSWEMHRRALVFDRR